MLKLNLQYFGHLMQKTDSLEKTLMLGRLGAGREGVSRGWDSWRASLTQWTWVWASFRSRWWTGKPGILQSERVRHEWTELNWTPALQADYLLVELPGKLAVIINLKERSGRFCLKEKGHIIRVWCSKLRCLIIDWLLIGLWGQFAAAAAAKSLQSCPTVCNPIDGSPPGSPIPGILQATYNT